MELPIFKYHPDPIKTGAIEVTSATCSVVVLLRATELLLQSTRSKYKLFVLGVLLMARQLKN
jgi:hypothetical protein